MPSTAPSATSPSLLAMLGSGGAFAPVGPAAAELPVVLTSTGGAAAPTMPSGQDLAVPRELSGVEGLIRCGIDVNPAPIERWS